MNVIKRGDPHFVCPDSINWIPGLQDSVTFAVAIYLSVRALDNIGEGLKPATGCREKWDDVSRKEDKGLLKPGAISKAGLWDRAHRRASETATIDDTHSKL
jgi:hypothetical protein